MKHLTEQDIVAHFGEMICQGVSKTNDARRPDTKTVRRNRCAKCGKRISISFVPKPGVAVLCRRCLRLRKQARKQ